MYHTIAEMRRLGNMSTIAQRVNAKDVNLTTSAMVVRGYDFDPRTLNDKERDFVFRSLFPIGLEAFVQNPSKGMERDIADHIFGAEHLLVMRSDGTFKFGSCEVGEPRPIAFRMWKMYDTSYGRALYLSGMCVSPAWQGTGIGQAMTQHVINVEKPDIVFTVTQNPVAKKCMDRALDAVSYPYFDRSTLLPNLGAELAVIRGIADHYDINTSVLRGHYGNSLYGRIPRSRDWRYEQLFTRLDRQKGDAYLCYHLCRHKV